MDGSSSSNGNRRNGKRASESLVDKVRERKRGVGIAKLEQMRVEEEMMKLNYLKDPFRGAHISGPGIGIQAMVSYGTSGNMSGLYIPPFARPPSISGAASHVNRSNAEPSRTLQLFPDHKGDEHESVGSKREGDNSLSVEPSCKNPNDQEDLDLDLDLTL